MKLSKYPRPTKDNRWGIHGGSNAWFPLGEHDNKIPDVLNEFEAMGIRWVKLLAKDQTAVPEVQQLLARGMMPVVRMYRKNPNPGSIMGAGDEMAKDRNAIKRYIELGARYFELNNEPNLLDAEWDPDRFPKDIHECVQIVCDNFFLDADYIQSLGGLPAFPSLTPTDGAPTAYNDIWFMELACQYIRNKGRQDIFHTGAWLSIHNAGLNHPVDYPDDPINQAEHPGHTIHTHRYPDGKPTGASNCWRKYEAIGKIFYDAFGFHVPVLSTEGGFWVDNDDDLRYPKLTPELQRDYTLEAMRKVVRDAPDWYFCTGHWLYFNRFGGNQTEQWERDTWVGMYGTLPIVQALKDEPKTTRLAPVDELDQVEMLPGVWVEDWREIIRDSFAWSGDYPNRPWPMDPELVGLCFHWQDDTGKLYTLLQICNAHYEKGWPGPGYHYEITQGGVIRWYQPPERISYHAGGDNNRKYLGILCQTGKDGRMTDAQVVAAWKLTQAIEKGLGKKMAIVGHGELKATACPGPAWEENRERIMIPAIEPPPDDNMEAVAKILMQINAARMTLNEIEESVKKL